MVAAGANGRFQQIKVDGRHLRAEKRVILLHFLCKNHTVVGAGHNFMMIMLLVTHAQGSNQGADADTRSPKVIDLVDL